jgi:hypothetical protein
MSEHLGPSLKPSIDYTLDARDRWWSELGKQIIGELRDHLIPGLLAGQDIQDVLRDGLEDE